MTPDQQRQFSQALSLPAEPAPLHLFTGAPEESEQRFQVYRNNVSSARVDALRQTFPVLERLLGADYFSAVAALFVRTAPPPSPSLHEYGDGFGHFLRQLPALSGMPWLSEVAQIERARVRAFHAADRQAFNMATSIAAPAQLLAVPLAWHPSVSLIRAASPAYSLWHSQRRSLPPPPAAQWQPEDVLVWRREFDLQTAQVSGEQCTLLNQLHQGLSLADAAAATGRAPAELAADLSLLLAWGCLCPA